VPLTSSSSLVVPVRLVMNFCLQISPLTRVLNDELDIKDGDYFALALTDIDVSIHANQLVHLSGNAILFGLEILDAVLEVLLSPGRSILVDPMPIIRVMEHIGPADEADQGRGSYCKSCELAQISHVNLSNSENLRRKSERDRSHSILSRNREYSNVH
jgi:hypothetical protein